MADEHNRQLALNKIRKYRNYCSYRRGKKLLLQSAFFTILEKTHKIGDIDEGNTVMDWMKEEQRARNPQLFLLRQPLSGHQLQEC